jgi:hypothetical protein
VHDMETSSAFRLGLEWCKECFVCVMFLGQNLPVWYNAFKKKKHRVVALCDVNITCVEHCFFCSGHDTNSCLLNGCVIACSFYDSIGGWRFGRVCYK